MIANLAVPAASVMTSTCWMCHHPRELPRSTKDMSCMYRDAAQPLCLAFKVIV